MRFYQEEQRFICSHTLNFDSESLLKFHSHLGEVGQTQPILDDPICTSSALLILQEEAVTRFDFPSPLQIHLGSSTLHPSLATPRGHWCCRGEMLSSFSLLHPGETGAMLSACLLQVAAPLESDHPSSQTYSSFSTSHSTIVATVSGMSVQRHQVAFTTVSNLSGRVGLQAERNITS